MIFVLCYMPLIPLW